MWFLMVFGGIMYISGKYQEIIKKVSRKYQESIKNISKRNEKKKYEKRFFLSIKKVSKSIKKYHQEPPNITKYHKETPRTTKKHTKIHQ